MSETPYALFQSGQQAFTYIADKDAPVNNFNRNDTKDLFYDNVLGARFNPHLHIIRKKKEEPKHKTVSNLSLEGDFIPGGKVRAVGWYDDARYSWSVAGVDQNVNSNTYPIEERDCGKILRCDARSGNQTTYAERLVPVVPEPEHLRFTEVYDPAHVVPGKDISVCGWYVDKDRQNCEFTWFSNNIPVPGSNSSTYRLQEEDIPTVASPHERVIKCQAVYKNNKNNFCELVIPALPTNRSETIPTPVVDLVKLEVIGGPFHLDPISVKATYTDGKYHPGACQWYRKNGQADDYLPLAGQTEETYQPNADDLHGNLFVQYTVLEGDKKGMVAKGAVKEEFLTINPDVQKAVEERVSAGSTSFNITDEKGQQRVLKVDKKKVMLTNPANPSNDSKVPHSGIVRVELQREPTAFRLILGPRAKEEPAIFKCADIKERDILAITMRSYVGFTVQEVEKIKGKGLHSVHSLADLGHFKK
jgi:hypothetical protein